MGLLAWFRKRRAKTATAKREPQSKPFRCGTPHLQSGGMVFLYTGNVVEIIRGAHKPPTAGADKQVP